MRPSRAESHAPLATHAPRDYDSGHDDDIAADVKAHLLRYVDSVHATHDRVTITRNGSPAAVLMSPDDLASLEETIAVLSDAQLMADIREGDSAVAAGEVTPLSEVAAQVRRDA